MIFSKTIIFAGFFRKKSDNKLSNECFEQVFYSFNSRESQTIKQQLKNYLF